MTTSLATVFEDPDGSFHALRYKDGGTGVACQVAVEGLIVGTLATATPSLGYGMLLWIKSVSIPASYPDMGVVLA